MVEAEGEEEDEETGIGGVYISLGNVEVETESEEIIEKYDLMDKIIVETLQEVSINQVAKKDVKAKKKKIIKGTITVDSGAGASVIPSMFGGK